MSASAYDGLVEGIPSRLVWNLEPGAHWFHYTTPAAARAIYETGFYVVGDRGSRPGLYITTIQPGTLSSNDLLNALFDGTRDLGRTEAVVVLRKDAAPAFTRVRGRSAWRHAADPGAELDLRDSLVGWAAYDGSKWMYHPALFA